MSITSQYEDIIRAAGGNPDELSDKTLSSLLECIADCVANGGGTSSGGGGGGGEEWRIIKTIKLTENVQNIIIDTDNDGKPFSLKKFIIWGWTQGTASGGQLRINAAVRTDSANSYFGSWIANFRGLDTSSRYWRFECSRGPVVGDHAKWYAENAAPDSGTTVQAMGATNWYHTPEDDNGNNILTATFINILSNTSTVQFAAGSEIEVWGVDA